MKIIPKHEIKNCQCCGKDFECKSGSILLCQCQSVVLSQEQRDYIASFYDDCLCASCMVLVRAEFNAMQHEEKIKQYSVR